MNMIHWIYIIDQSGASIFSYENHVQGSGNGNLSLLSHFLFALQSIAKTLKENEIRSVEMSNNRFFICKEKMTDYVFILKTNRDADSEVIKPILKEIKEKFIYKFTGHLKLVLEDKIELLNSFKQDVKAILQQNSNIQKFTETL